MSLSRLLAMQAAAKNKTADSKPDPTPAIGESAAQESVADVAPPATESPAPAPKKLPFGKPAPKPVTAPAPTPAPKPEKQEFDLDNMGDFDLSSIGESKDEEGANLSGFFDEIEATAPDRELPEDMTPQMEGFVESLNSIYLTLNDSDLFAQSVRQIMMELQENPEYLQLVSDTDVHVMIRAMRNTMGLARVRKQAKSRKTGSTASKTRAPSRKQALMDKALGLMVDMDVG